MTAAEINFLLLVVLQQLQRQAVQPPDIAPEQFRLQLREDTFCRRIIIEEIFCLVEYNNTLLHVFKHRVDRSSLHMESAPSPEPQHKHIHNQQSKRCRKIIIALHHMSEKQYLTAIGSIDDYRHPQDLPTQMERIFFPDIRDHREQRHQNRRHLTAEQQEHKQLSLLENQPVTMRKRRISHIFKHQLMIITCPDDHQHDQIIDQGIDCHPLRHMILRIETKEQTNKISHKDEAAVLYLQSHKSSRLPTCHQFKQIRNVEQQRHDHICHDRLFLFCAPPPICPKQQQNRQHDHDPLHYNRCSQSLFLPIVAAHPQKTRSILLITNI